jgi:hypothetical protein
MQPVIIREYRTRRQYERDANKMARQGYPVQSTTEGHTSKNFPQLILSGELFMPRRRIIGPILVDGANG